MRIVLILLLCAPHFRGAINFYWHIKPLSHSYFQRNMWYIGRCILKFKQIYKDTAICSDVNSFCQIKSVAHFINIRISHHIYDLRNLSTYCFASINLFYSDTFILWLLAFDHLFQCPNRCTADRGSFPTYYLLHKICIHSSF